MLSSTVRLAASWIHNFNILKCGAFVTLQMGGSNGTGFLKGGMEVYLAHDSGNATFVEPSQTHEEP